MAVIDEVIVALKFYKLICPLLNIVDVECAICLRSIHEYHLTFCIKVVFAFRQFSTFKEFCSKVKGLVLCNLVAIIDEVIVALKFYKLICLLLNAITIYFIIKYTSKQFSLSVVAKIINQGDICIRYS